MNEGAAGEGGSNVADRTDDGSPKLAARKSRTARGGVIESRTHSTGISEYLADSEQNRKGSGESEPDDIVQSQSETEAADGSKDSFPWQRVMILSTSCSIEFNGYGDTGCNSGSYAKNKPKAQAVADSEDQGVRDCPGEQSQRAMLSAEQVISKVEAAYDIETSACNAYGCKCVMLHAKIVERPCCLRWVRVATESKSQCGTYLDHPRRTELGQTLPQSLLRHRHRVVEVHDAVRLHAIVFLQEHFGGDSANRRSDWRNGDSRQICNRAVASEDHHRPLLVWR